jgi:membrane associated rhomboid family serine protease
MDIANTNILVGWIAMLSGAVSGAILGLFFHREGWAGGYGSFRRQMMRLGHISFFGIGFLNLLFGLTLSTIPLPPTHSHVASAGFLVAVVAMPACCFLTAWKKHLRHLFPIPVLAVLTGIIPVLLGWPAA